MAGGWLNGVKRDFTKDEALKEYFYFLADDSLILGQQLSKWCSNGPVLEQDIAIINTALDHIGRARLLYQELARLKGCATEDTSRTSEIICNSKTRCSLNNLTVIGAILWFAAFSLTPLTSTYTMR